MKSLLSRVTPKMVSWGQRIYIALMSIGISIATAQVPEYNPTHNVWEGDVDVGLGVLDRAITLSVVVGVAIVAMGFVLGGIKYIKSDDMQGSKDIFVKCAVAGAVIAVAPALVKFIIGSFGIGDYSSELGR